jgi:exodeoxyribonuclease V
MNSRILSDKLIAGFPYQPTAGQTALIDKLCEFALSRSFDNEVFILDGFAGTGKTSVLCSLVKVLPETGIRTVLLAPTGRAAKVLSGYAGKQAFTIHKKLYKIQMDGTGNVKLVLSPNLHTQTIFIVDEASMIPDDRTTGDSGMFQSRNLLQDLFEFVFSGENCKLLFLGDTAQLPPVGSLLSPALDPEYIKTTFEPKITYFRLSDVVRQSLNSGILAEATFLRDKITQDKPGLPLFEYNNHYPDVQNINGTEMLDMLNSCYSRYGEENTLVITRSNKRANLYNAAIRSRIFFKEDELSTGDHLMVVRNNYFWLPEESEAGFIANGDIIEVLNLSRREELYGFHFAEATIRMLDYPNIQPFDVKVLTETLSMDTPALSYDENRRLFNEVMADYEDIANRRKKMASVRSNPHFNALQIKHAYSLTCHKTQGGQWDAVFIEKGFLTDDMLDREYLRWLYTAITRATQEVYLVNFEERFFLHS